ncbi:hypothetical protein ACR784_21565 [Sphingobacterium multivorum]|uniref:hypothetical protein n=1 Tax=Sphingobacterium multivorum TaxID=28454 RepID=UPI003DA4F38F
MRTLAKRIIGTLGTGALIAGIIIGANAHDKKDEVNPKTTSVSKAELIEWHFNGLSNSEKLDASKYSEYNSEPCGGTKQTVCVILAPEDGSNPGQPDMSYDVTPGNSVADRISAAVPTSGTPTTNETVISLRSF